jgi:hypothetical protein
MVAPLTAIQNGGLGIVGRVALHNIHSFGAHEVRLGRRLPSTPLWRSPHRSPRHEPSPFQFPTIGRQ